MRRKLPTGGPTFVDASSTESSKGPISTVRDLSVTMASAAVGGKALAGQSVMERLRKLVERVAGSSISVLILGETGVGKEVMAETVHRLSARSARPFLRLNSAGLSESLLESELFGHERGAFTGAVGAKPGLLESADGGTVFLDEVGELSLSVQARLLRVIEERRVLRVGGLKSRPIDVRFVAATNRDLEAAVARGLFRQDLFFRLNGVALMIPPLRERLDEIEGLARAFIARVCREGGSARPIDLTPKALELLQRYSWPGNIRELRNVIERAVLLCSGGKIRAEDLPIEEMVRTLTPPRRTTPPPDGPQALRRQLDVHEFQRIVDALEHCAGNQTKAARLLGISRGTLIARIEAFGLPRPRKPALNNSCTRLNDLQGDSCSESSSQRNRRSDANREP